MAPHGMGGHQKKTIGHVRRTQSRRTEAVRLSATRSKMQLANHSNRGTVRPCLTLDTVSDATAPSASDAAFRKMLPMLAISWGGLALFCIVLLVKRPEGWHLGLFIWGLAIGLVGILNQRVSNHVLPRLVGASDEETAKWRARSGLRGRIYTVSYIVLGVTIGVFSATTNIVWIDIGFTVFAVLMWTAGYALVPLMAKRIRKRRPPLSGDI